METHHSLSSQPHRMLPIVQSLSLISPHSRVSETISITPSLSTPVSYFSKKQGLIGVYELRPITYSASCGFLAVVAAAAVVLVEEIPVVVFALLMERLMRRNIFAELHLETGFVFD